MSSVAVAEMIIGALLSLASWLVRWRRQQDDEQTQIQGVGSILDRIAAIVRMVEDLSEERGQDKMRLVLEELPRRGIVLRERDARWLVESALLKMEADR